MIDTKELRRLVQAATPGPWINYGRQPNAPGAPHSAVAAKTLLARVYSEAYGDVAQETANADLIAAANPAALSELLDRLEAAEQTAQDYLRIDREKAQIAQRLEAAENDAAHQKALAESALRVAEEWERVAEGWERTCGELRAKVAEMEQQEPVVYQRLYKDGSGSEDITDFPDVFERQRPLYALPGAQAQPAPGVPEGWAQHAARMATLARKLRELDWCFESVREMQRELRMLEEAALAAAPEAKPCP